MGPNPEVPKGTNWKALILAVIAVILGGGTVAVVVDPNDEKAPPQSIEVKVDGADKDRLRDDVITLSPTEQKILEDVTGRPAEETAEGDLEAGPLREPGDGPAVTNEGPLAAQETPGCRTRFVINSSSRNGSPVKVIVWHQTVSRDRGQASQDALTAMANSRSSGVSWHYLIGGTSGLCTYSVPLNLKAWTQGNANPFSVGIEIERFGDEPNYTTGKGTTKLLAVTRYIGKRYGIPMRKGSVQNCRVVRSGIVEHSDLGACGGGHADVTPWSTASLISQLGGPSCDLTCQRRKRHAAAHRELKARGCAPPERTRSDRCRFLHRRVAALHKVGVKF